MTSCVAVVVGSALCTSEEGKLSVISIFFVGRLVFVLIAGSGSRLTLLDIFCLGFRRVVQDGGGLRFVNYFFAGQFGRGYALFGFLRGRPEHYARLLGVSGE